MTASTQTTIGTPATSLSQTIKSAHAYARARYSQAMEEYNWKKAYYPGLRKPTYREFFSKGMQLNMRDYYKQFRSEREKHQEQAAYYARLGRYTMD